MNFPRGNLLQYGGQEGFSGNAADTLRFLTRQVIPTLKQQFALPENVRIILGGYSLAGLFALWASTQTDFESLNRLDEAGFVRLSWAVVGIFCASQKCHIIAIYRQKSTAFCEVPLESSPFTQNVRGCISGAVPLDVRYSNSHISVVGNNCELHIANKMLR